MIRDLLKFLWRRDSESASLVIIHVACYMSIKDMGDMAEYLKSYAENRRASGAENQ